MAQGSWKQLRENTTTVLEGDFPVEITKSIAATSSNGNPMIKVTAKVTAGPFAGRTLFGNFVVSDSQFGMKNFFRHMEALGADSKFFDTEPSMEAVAAQINGRQAIVTVTKREWNGEDRENITDWKKAGGPFVSTAGSSSPFGGASELPAAKKAEPSVAEDKTAPPDDPF